MPSFLFLLLITYVSKNDGSELLVSQSIFVKDRMENYHKECINVYKQRWNYGWQEETPPLLSFEQQNLPRKILDFFLFNGLQVHLFEYQNKYRNLHFSD